MWSAQGASFIHRQKQGASRMETAFAVYYGSYVVSTVYGATRRRREDLRVGAPGRGLERAGLLQDCRERLEQDAEIEQDRPSIDVLPIQPHHLFKRGHGTPPVHLP